MVRHIISEMSLPSDLKKFVNNWIDINVLNGVRHLLVNLYYLYYMMNENYYVYMI